MKEKNNYHIKILNKTNTKYSITINLIHNI